MLSWGISRVARSTTVPGWSRRLGTLTDEVRSDTTFHIPVVDFSTFRNPRSPVDKERIAREVVGAFKEVQVDPLSSCLSNVTGSFQVGFVYLKGHGVSNMVVKDVFQKVIAMC